MERVLVEGTVKEAWGRRFKISIANHRRDRVTETKILAIEGFHRIAFKPLFLYFGTAFRINIYNDRFLS